jgi:release factor glutamine methyltransferase
MKTIEEAIQDATRCLDGVGIENARLESEFLLAACLQVPRTHLILHRQKCLSTEKIRAVQAWLNQRQRRKPLAYVSGEQSFRNLRLKISPAVLIPRPETELLVEQAFRMLERMHRPAVAVDVGTGSGAIALSLSAHPNVAKVIAIDISPEALQVARANGEENHHAPVEWLEGDLLTPLVKRRVCVDIVVANLPYVRSSEMRRLEPELHWEPSIALDGGEDGLRFIRPCARQTAEVLRPGGYFLLEIGADEAPPVTGLLERQRDWTDIQVFRDFAGLPRIVQCKRKEI